MGQRVWMVLAGCLASTAFSAVAHASPAPVPVQAPAMAGCGALPTSGGRTIDLTPVDAPRLRSILQSAQPGDVVQLADGIYPMSGEVGAVIATADVTLISKSRDASKVVLEPAGTPYSVRELLQITASRVVIAHLTLRQAQDHLVHLMGGRGDVDGGRLYGLILEDAGQQFVKANPAGPTGPYVDRVTVECSTFTMSEAGRRYVPRNPDSASYGCYTGGIDAHAAVGWIVRANRFSGIYCDDGGLAEHAIHFWMGGRDQLIERNVVINCARAIGLGLTDGQGRPVRPYPDRPHAADGDGYVGDYDGLVRNNAIYADIGAFDSGISLEQAMGARVYHNTILVTGEARGAAIDYRFPNSLVDIRNNLVTSIVARDGARGRVEHNGLRPDIGLFRDPAHGDLRLRPGASVERGVPLAEAGRDLDDRPRRGEAPDLGADQRPR
jgi:hypothetical protein